MKEEKKEGRKKAKKKKKGRPTLTSVLKAHSENLEKLEEKASKEFEFLQEARKKITQDQLKIDVERRKLDALYRKVHREMERTRKTHEEFLTTLNSSFQEAMFSIHQGNQKIESFEDSMLHILHNIKRNQFLYSHYPEEWVKNYQSLKEGLKAENEFMERKEAL